MSSVREMIQAQQRAKLSKERKNSLNGEKILYSGMPTPYETPEQLNKHFTRTICAGWFNPNVLIQTSQDGYFIYDDHEDEIKTDHSCDYLEIQKTLNFVCDNIHEMSDIMNKYNSTIKDTDNANIEVVYWSSKINTTINIQLICYYDSTSKPVQGYNYIDDIAFGPRCVWLIKNGFAQFHSL